MIYGMGMIALCASWLLPGHYFPWASFQQDLLAGMGAVLIALATLVAEGQRRYPISKVAIVGFALATVPLLQWSLGMIPFFGDALLCSLFLGAFAVSIIAGQALTSTQGSAVLMALGAAIIVAAITSVGIGLVQWLGLGDHEYIEHLSRGARVYANITQPNNLASLLALGIVSLLWVYETRRMRGASLTLGLVFLGFGLVMTQSRTAWLFVIGLAIWVAVKRNAIPLRTKLLPLIFAVAFFVFATAFWQPLNDALGLSLVDTTSQRATSGGTRPVNWLVLLDAAIDRPWFGHGWFQVSAALQSSVLDHPAQHEWITYSHNIILDLIVYNGFPIGLAVAAAGGWWVASRIARCRDVDSWAALAGIGAVLIHAMLEFPHAYAYFLVPLGLLVGVVEARHRQTTPEQDRTVPRYAFAAIWCGLVGMSSWVAVEYLEIEDAARTLRLQEAGYIADGKVPIVPPVVLLDNQREFLRFRMMPATEGMSATELETMRTVSQRFAPPAAMLRYALATGLNGRNAESQRTLKVLCHMWTRYQCDEGRDSWNAAQARYPKLSSIAYPPTPP